MNEYLVCDLDDCLLKTDLLYEQWLLLFKKNPLLALIAPVWLLGGRANLKAKICDAIPLDPAMLPYRTSVLDYLKKQRETGKKKLILASASPLPWVTAVSQYLGIFEQAIGSTPTRNLKGEEKLKALRELIGSAEFTYVADHAADLPIWKDSKEIIAVNANESLKVKIQELQKPTQYLHDVEVSKLKLVTKQLRPHQWIKNALVFLPALAGHKFFTDDTIINGLFAFAGFSATASLVYVCNDLLDLKSDRNHHSKKKRPFASGDLPVKWGLALVPCLLLVSGLFALLLPTQYKLWILTYLVLNLAYSIHLKQSVIIDIIILSMMYTLRIFAGSAATSVPVSEWLLSFSTLFFFSLACVKRYTEIVRSKNKITLDGRGYRQVDGGMVASLGVGSGLISILIILLYLQSNDVRSLYGRPENLWFATPILLFWISRIWILTNRDEIHDDPVVFAVKDKMSWVCLALLAFVFGIAT